jgi:hypothetical protein
MSGAEASEQPPARQPERRYPLKPPTFPAATRTLQPPRQPRLIPLATSATAVA